MARTKKSNNGYVFEFEDGTYGWTIGFSRAQRQWEESRHGKLIKYIPA